MKSFHMQAKKGESMLAYRERWTAMPDERFICLMNWVESVLGDPAESISKDHLLFALLARTSI
jgi:hypothetical protein